MKVLLLLLLLLIVGGLGYWQFFYNKAEVVPTVLRVGNNALYVSDQRADAVVTVALVSLDRSGYVVIYADNKGIPGDILGNSAILSAGEHRKVSVRLIRFTSNGEHLFAVLHEDNGDGSFYPPVDTSIKDQDGNAISMPFVIDNSAQAPPEIKL